MIERCHHTLEDIIKKVMYRQEDWIIILESALLGMRSTGPYASTGYTPMCMLYNKDPVMPFQIVHKLKHSSMLDSSGNHVEETCEITSSVKGGLIYMVEQ